MSYLSNLLDEFNMGKAVPDPAAPDDTRADVPPVRKRPQRDSPVVLVGRLREQLAAYEREKAASEKEKAGLALRLAQHPVGDNGHCNYNINRFGSGAQNNEDMQRELVALREELVSLKINMRIVNNQNDQRIHQIERSSLKRQLAQKTHHLDRTTRQLHQAHTKLAQNGFSVPRARKVPSPQAQPAADTPDTNTHVPSPEKKPLAHDPVICQLFLHGKCKSSAVRCASNGYLHVFPDTFSSGVNTT